MDFFSIPGVPHVFGNNNSWPDIVVCRNQQEVVGTETTLIFDMNRKLFGDRSRPVSLISFFGGPGSQIGNSYGKSTGSRKYVVAISRGCFFIRKSEVRPLVWSSPNPCGEYHSWIVGPLGNMYQSILDSRPIWEQHFLDSIAWLWGL